MKTSLPLLFAFLFSLLPLAAEEKPNFLLLLSDDQAWNGLSCEMHPEIPESKSPIIETPNIARLAGEGMRFSAAYSPASVCSPTRISLQTGKSPAQCKWTKAAPTATASDGYKLIPPKIQRTIGAEETTIGEMLRSAGYTTAHYGKWHLDGGGPESHGYDESDGNTGNEAAAPFVDPNPVDIFGMGERASALMKEATTSKSPFFIQMSYHALHYPQNAPADLVEKYRTKLPNGNEKEIGRAALSEALDQGVGLLLDTIKELGIGETTYVIYFSDNGSSTKRILRGGKGGVWEGGIRVPLIVRGPGIAPNSWSHERVVGYDLYPTFCELAGVSQPLPEGIEGGSLTSLFRGNESPVARPREGLVFHFPHYQGDRPHSAIFLDQWKAIHFYETKQTHLFDLKTDIGENADLSGTNPEITAELQTRLFNYLQEIDAQLPTENPDYDPDNPPSFKTMKGGGKGKGRDKKNRKPKKDR